MLKSPVEPEPTLTLGSESLQMSNPKEKSKPSMDRKPCSKEKSNEVSDYLDSNNSGCPK